LNAFAERWVRSVRDECLGQLILFGESSLRRALTQFTEHYHSERNYCSPVPTSSAGHVDHRFDVESDSAAFSSITTKGRMNFLTTRDLHKSLRTGRFAVQLTKSPINCQFLSWASAVPSDYFETGTRNTVTRSVASGLR